MRDIATQRYVRIWAVFCIVDSGQAEAPLCVVNPSYASAIYDARPHLRRPTATAIQLLYGDSVR